MANKSPKKKVWTPPPAEVRDLIEALAELLADDYLRRSKEKGSKE